MRYRGMTIVCAVVGMLGCGELKDGVVEPLSPLPDPLTYQRDIRPILQQHCVSCHTGGKAEGGYDLSGLSGVLGKGSDGAPNAIPGHSASRLLTALQGATHAGRTGGADNLSALQKWVVEDRMGMIQPTVHPAGWMDTGSSAFHGVAIESAGWDMTSCQSCHGATYAGGVAKSPCITCHVDTPEGCSACHGSGANPAPPLDLSGNFATSVRGVGAHQAHLAEGELTDAMACSACHTAPQALHDAGHVDSGAPAEVRFTGLAAMNGASPVWNGETCQNTYCHGVAAPVWTGVGGGEAACGTCHSLPPDMSTHPKVDACELCHGGVVDADRKIIDKSLHVNGQVDVSFGHPDGFANPTSPNFHTVAIRDAGWQLSDCQSCHGADYAGGTVGVSCLTCHPNTPESCATCHGSATSFAPPKDLDDHTDTGFRGVGAHQTHLTQSAVARALECRNCHAVPTQVADAGHIDSSLPAEVTFGTLALTGGAAATWDGATCANTYCHGTFKGGNQVEATWTDVAVGQAACGTCHGTPPPAAAGHPPVSQCSLCHPRVADANLNIVNRTLHINGKVEIGQ